MNFVHRYFVAITKLLRRFYYPRFFSCFFFCHNNMWPLSLCTLQALKRRVKNKIMIMFVVLGIEKLNPTRFILAKLIEMGKLTLNT